MIFTQSNNVAANFSFNQIIYVSLDMQIIMGGIVTTDILYTHTIYTDTICATQQIRIDLIHRLIHTYNLIVLGTPIRWKYVYIMSQLI